MGFRLIPTSMTLNDLEQRNSPYFAFFQPNSIALVTNCVAVVEDRPVMSLKYGIPIPVFHFWLKLTHRAAWSLRHSHTSQVVPCRTNDTTVVQDSHNNQV